MYSSEHQRLDTKNFVIYLDFHQQNEHCDWLNLGQVPLIKFNCCIASVI